MHVFGGQNPKTWIMQLMYAWIRETAIQHGFEIRDGFLYHPEDWPAEVGELVGKPKAWSTMSLDDLKLTRRFDLTGGIPWKQQQRRASLLSSSFEAMLQDD